MPSFERQPCVYILTNWKHTVFYTGVTTDPLKADSPASQREGSRFALRYNLNKLVFVELTAYVDNAIAREKQIKSGSRQNKIDLITAENPNWDDLFLEYFGNISDHELDG